jgi:membrane associated rhomboid family serine protease
VKYFEWLPDWAQSTTISRCIVIGLIVIEASSAASGILKNLDHASHLGGYITGIIGAELLMWRARKREKEHRETIESKAV